MILEKWLRDRLETTLTKDAENSAATEGRARAREFSKQDTPGKDRKQSSKSYGAATITLSN